MNRTHPKINGVARQFPDERAEALEDELKPSFSESEGQGAGGRKLPQ